MRTPRIAVLLLAVLLALSLVAEACASDDSASTDADADTPDDTAGTDDAGTSTTVGEDDADQAAVFPGAEWTTADPAEHGIDQARLDELATQLEGFRSNCMAVIKDGYLLDVRYWNDTGEETNQEIWSASKSVTSTLVGIAQDKGMLDIDEPASKYIDEWQGTPSEDITIENLISNNSGRHWDFETDYLTMAAGAQDKTAFAIGLDQQFAPGEHWEYNNSAIQTLEAVLEEATGQPVGEFAEENLFGPIGMSSTIRTDPAGNALTFMGTQAGCLDMARFGYLALNKGNWDGTQVVSEEYMTEAAAASQELNTIYGYLWWRNSDGQRLRFTGEVIDDGTWAWPDSPHDAFAAQGLGGQLSIVVPSENLVVVRLGPSTTQGEPEGDTNDILDTLLN
jgi:CubicO group peptidase (beta-lactamase class C family)